VLEHQGLAGDPDRHPLPYLLAGDASRIGGLDITDRPDVHEDRRPGVVPLEDLLAAAERLDRGDDLDARLELALRHGTSVGGARPKAHLEDADGRALIAKFGRLTDSRPVVQAEFVAMELARRAGLRVAPVRLEQALGREVLLVERFDRPGDGSRRLLVSARTILGLGPQGIGASYADLADQVRARFTDPVATVHELFARVTFNILVGNTDDHARNHAAFWDGRRLSLTPAYDLCPQLRTGGEASQAMAIGPDGYRLAQLVGCVERAGHYLLDPGEARAIVDHQLAVIRQGWAEVADHARLSRAQRDQLWERAFLHPFALEGW
jgi:serine/threonine-protein kinase HipA